MEKYIEREALLKHLQECRETSVGSCLTFAVIAAVQAYVGGMPAADVAPVVHGEWLLRHEGYGHYWECSSCHKSPCIYVTKDTRYCPNCGAKMDGKGEEA